MTHWLTPQFDRIAPELRHLPWAVWRAESDPGRPGKFKKAPRCPKHGTYLKVDQPESWSTFDSALRAFEPVKYTGVGLLLNNDGIVGIDIDNIPILWNQRPDLVSYLADLIASGTYIERSPSGKGIRAFLKGKLPKDCSHRCGGLEIYDSRRFLTVTGHTITSIEEIKP